MDAVAVRSDREVVGRGLCGLRGPSLAHAQGRRSRATQGLITPSRGVAFHRHYSCGKGQNALQISALEQLTNSDNCGLTGPVALAAFVP